MPNRRGVRDHAIRHRSSPDHSGFHRATAWTIVAALIPGAGLLAAGRRVLGAAVLAGFGVLVAGGVWLATTGQRRVVSWAVDPTALIAVTVVVVAMALAWALLLVASHEALMPSRTSPGQRAVGWLLVSGLVVIGAVPTVALVDLATSQRRLVQQVFADDRRSATVAEPTAAAEPDAPPFGGQGRLNVLLLGGDGGEGRDGVRTDTVVVASIDVASGATTLFSLPRNLEELPFPAASPLSDIYPDGFDVGTESESLLNAVYRNGPAENPGILGTTDDPGADFLKLGVGAALGLTIDYYVLVNLDGFSRLIDSLGGVKVNVNYFVPVGGEPTSGRLPDSYIAPGPNQLMDGETALAFSRARFGTSDYQRMARQRCVIDAIVTAVDPMTLPLRYGEFAATTQDIVSTDVPRAVLDDVVDLAFAVKDAEIRSIVFDDTLISPANPDYDEIRRLVRLALAPPVVAATTSPPTTTLPSQSGPSRSQPSSSQPSSSQPSTSASATTEPLDTADVCAYDAVAAREARLEGEPPTYRR